MQWAVVLTLACLVENGDVTATDLMGCRLALAVSNSLTYFVIDACVSLIIVSFSSKEFI